MQDLENTAFEILRFGCGRESGMILALRAVLDLTKLHMCVPSRVADDVHESGGQDVLGAGAGDKVAAVTHHLHGAKVNLFISAGSAGHSGTGFGKGDQG